MGDTPFWLYLFNLCAGKKPLLKRSEGGTFSLPTDDPHDTAFRDQQLVLTSEGKKALAGQTDWIKINCGIDRWLGGVHLQGKNAIWRWDRQRTMLVQVQSAA